MNNEIRVEGINEDKTNILRMCALEWQRLPGASLEVLTVIKEDNVNGKLYYGYSCDYNITIEIKNHILFFSDGGHYWKQKIFRER